MKNKGFILIELMIVVAIIGMLSVIGISSCRSNITKNGADTKVITEETDSQAGQILRGDHELIPLSYINGKPEWFRIHGAKFIFSFKVKKIGNSIASIAIEKLRYKFNDASKPKIKFKWNKTHFDKTFSEIIEEQVVYAVLSCKESTWYNKGIEERK